MSRSLQPLIQAAAPLSAESSSARSAFRGAGLSQRPLATVHPSTDARSKQQEEELRRSRLLQDIRRLPPMWAHGFLHYTGAKTEAKTEQVCNSL